MSTAQERRDLPPPRLQFGVVGWLRQNLFNGWYNSLLTLVAGYLLIRYSIPVIEWAVLEGRFAGVDASACVPEGACWPFVIERFGFFIYGFYPVELRWRVNIVFILLAVAFAPQFIERFPGRRWLGIFGLTGFPVIALILIHGGVLGLEPVPPNRWGGLLLTLMLAYGGILAALPLGTMLALGRRSTMPVIRGLSVVFIEIWRAVPLITVLFMASVMLPLFLPEGVNFNKILRAQIGIILFQSAYMAEVVRGGLQAIPKGQYEAADALGLSYWKKTGLVILPQALKLVIPGIVNTFIALFKDTSLVLIIGLFDLLGTVQSTIVDPAWQDVAVEGYVFAGAIYFLFCFGLSRYSQNLERKLETGHQER